MIQLRIRTEYTFGRTFAPIPRVIERLKAIGCTAAGIVDTNSTWGHIAWFTACNKAGIQPILGIETVVSDSDENQQQMWFLAKDTAGLSELYRAISQSHQQPIPTPFGSVPRLYRQDVLEMTDHIVKFAGGIEDAEFLKECGAHLDLNPSSRMSNLTKTKLAATTGLHLVETSDNYFAAPEDKTTFEFAQRGRLKQTPQYILDKLKHQDVAAGIASECNGLKLPSAPMVRAEGNLEAICRQGIAYRGMAWNDTYEQRLQYELNLIRSKDFESYFIIVADMVHHAKQHMLVGPSRGSAAGSLVCYTSRITEINPIPPGLFFERFIDVTRTDLPDIDLDFPDDKRQIVFDYMAKKYGSNNVGHIGTIAQFKPKSALIQVCKALNIPPHATAALKVAMIERSSADSRASNCLQDTFETTEPGKAFIQAYPEAAVSQLLEGHASHTGTHAAGLLVCNDMITNYTVVDANNIAHLDKNSAELLGLLKIDVLGLRTLGVLEDSGVDVDWYGLTFDDPATYDVFNQGRLCGIFQFEGNALRSISKNIQFKSLVEIDAVTALARPGPFGGGVTEKYVKRKNGEPYEPIHPLVEKHMADTFGLPLYQEQTLAIVREIGKFDWKETSTIRKAMSKRMGKEFFDSYWEKFRVGAESQGVDVRSARATWDMINAMGAWQMNKCAAEGTLVRMTANNAGVPIWCPIEDLYEKYIANPSKWVRQNKSMPRLLSLFPDGRGKPQRAKTIHKNGKKRCVELTFDDGTKIRCTKDHNFIINDQWQSCENISIGSKFLSLRRDTSHKNTGNRNGIKNGRFVAERKFRILMKGKPCQKCGERKRRREVHHKDFDMGKIRPYWLAWLCSSCHKLEHKKHGDRGNPFKRGHEQTFKTLIGICDVGVLETYDIEMPKHHNFVINGGLVTHNSHTYSYAVISYWTAWLKAHHPLEFAAANMRNAKDEDSAIELLREMVREGVQYTAFDLEKSEVNWVVKDGHLYGGFMALKGIGDAKADQLVEARNTGRLTEKQIETIKNAENPFTDLFPFQTKYGNLYSDPAANNINDPVMFIGDITEGIPHRHERVFLGELIHKNARNANEEVNVKKRGGVVITKGPLEFLDLRLRDDTGVIGGRVSRWDYQSIGKSLLENVPVGAHLLIRAKFYNGIRYAFIRKYKVLNGAGQTNG